MTPTLSGWLRRARAGALAAAIAGALLSTSLDAGAQCGAATSTCRQCHEVEGSGPLPGAGKWHSDHALGDFCADCHGGDRTNHDESAAHAGLVDPTTRCVVCHAGEDAKQKAYGDSVTRRAATTPKAPAPVSSPRGRPPRGGTAPADAVLATLAVAIALAGIALARYDTQRGRGSLRGALREREWSPYVAGALLGVVAAVSMAFFGHRLSGGGAYQQLSAPVGRLLAENSTYFNRVLEHSAAWELAGLVGALAGAFTSARLGKTFRIRTMPDADWEPAFGPSVKKRWLFAFLGAALTEIASGIAGGCTASLAVSGGAALAPGAFVFMMGMFLGGIPTAFLVHRRGRT